MVTRSVDQSFSRIFYDVQNLPETTTLEEKPKPLTRIVSAKSNQPLTRMVSAKPNLPFDGYQSI